MRAEHAAASMREGQTMAFSFPVITGGDALSAVPPSCSMESRRLPEVHCHFDCGFVREGGRVEGS